MHRNNDDVRRRSGGLRQWSAADRERNEMSGRAETKAIRRERLIAAVLLAAVVVGLSAFRDTSSIVTPSSSAEARPNASPEGSPNWAAASAVDGTQAGGPVLASGDAGGVQISDEAIILAHALLPSHASRPADGPLAAECDPERQVLLKNIQLLDEGSRTFQRVPCYTATFVRQERINGDLHDAEEIELKVRHQPFSVYMQWFSADTGRELLYVEGLNQGRMLVRLGGWKGRVLPALNVDPHGADALEQSRHPIGRAGILALAGTMLENRRSELARNVKVRCAHLENRRRNGRDCHYFCFEFDTPSESEVYRKLVQYIDREWLVPICVQNYTWPDPPGGETGVSLDDDTLIEYYSYSNINLELRLSDVDFDRTNPVYRLR